MKKVRIRTKEKKKILMQNSKTCLNYIFSSRLDDCISPGYHTSLPLEVHGAGYSEMQMISKNSCKKLMCPTIIVTQITFDLEAFTYYAVNYLCSINNKKYGFFFDCGCEIVKVKTTKSHLQPLEIKTNFVNISRCFLYLIY